MAHNRKTTLHKSSPPHLPRGFLPSDDPLLRLPEASFDFNIWLNLTVESLPKLIRDKRLRCVIDSMNAKLGVTPFIHISRLDPRQVNAAYLVLTMLTQAYLWEDRSQPANVIPRILSENLNVMRRFYFHPRIPVLTYADYVLQNWRRIDPTGPITPENVEPLFMFTGSPEEAWFIKIHVAVEAAFVGAIEAAYQIHLLVNDQPAEMEDVEAAIAHQFSLMEKSIAEATAVLSRMREHCSYAFFLNELRPFLEGTDKAGGIIFDLPGDHDAPESVSYRGSSGAQSSSLPALDAILNIEHPDDAMTKFLQAFLDYMPAQHQAFIRAMQNNAISDSAERREAIKQLWLFRKTHKEISTQYISKPAAEKGLRPEEITGTGSTNVSLFLGKRERRTLDAVVENGGAPRAKL